MANVWALCDNILCQLPWTTNPNQDGTNRNAHAANKTNNERKVNSSPSSLFHQFEGQRLSFSVFIIDSILVDMFGRIFSLHCCNPRLLTKPYPKVYLFANPIHLKKTECCLLFTVGNFKQPCVFPSIIREEGQSAGGLAYQTQSRRL